MLKKHDEQLSLTKIFLRFRNVSVPLEDFVLWILEALPIAKSEPKQTAITVAWLSKLLTLSELLLRENNFFVQRP